MNDSAMTNNEIRLTKIDMDGQVYYSQFAVNLFNDKIAALEAELIEARKVIEFYANENSWQSPGEQYFTHESNLFNEEDLKDMIDNDDDGIIAGKRARDFLTKHTKE